MGKFFQIVILKPFIFLLLLSIILGCKEDKPIAGFDMLTNPNDRGRVDNAIINNLEIEETFSDTITATGRSILLLLGEFDNVRSQILLKFETPDTVTINDAALILNTNTIYSDGENKSSFRATLHRVTADWDERDVTFENFGNSFESNSIGETEILTTGSGLSENDSLFESVRFELTSEGTELVRSWADTTLMNNFGVLVNFDPVEAEFMKEFFSQNSPIGQPRLELEVLENGSELDTIMVVATADAYLVESIAEPPSGPLYVDNVFSRQSVVKFDLLQIPRESTINRASLTLNVKKDNSIIKNIDGYVIQIDALTAPFESVNQFDRDSTLLFTDKFIRNTDSPVIIEMAPLLQSWVAESIENHGILIRVATANAGRDISRVAFHSNTTSTNLAPRIEVEFSRAPAAP